MAVSGPLARAMGISEQQSIHPFFAKPTRSQPQAVVVQNGSKRATYNESQDSYQSEKEALGHRHVNGSQRVDERPDKPLSASAQPSPCPAPEPASEIAPSHRSSDSFTQKMKEIHEASLDSDPNTDRKKRRKITPLGADTYELNSVQESKPAKGMAVQSEEVASMAWHEQLRAEANMDSYAESRNLPGAAEYSSGSVSAGGGPSPLPSTPLQDRSMAPPSSPTSEGTNTVRSSSLPLPTESNGTVRAASNQVSHDADSHVTDSMAGDDSDPPKPPRKMLRINAKGKFSSPISKRSPKKDERPFIEERGRRRRPRAQQRKELIAVMKYGENEARKEALAEAIGKILNKGHSDASIQNKSPAEPPKPTHPFFLGKEMRKPEVHVISTASADVPPSRPRKDERRPAAVTPGKLRTQVQAESAARNVPESDSHSGFLKRNKQSATVLGAAWPRKGAVHVRGLEHDRITNSAKQNFSVLQMSPFVTRKKKGKALVIAPHENILNSLETQLHVHEHPSKSTKHTDTRMTRSLRVPERILTSGVRMQNLALGQLQTRLSISRTRNGHESASEDELSSLEKGASHQEILIQAYNELGTTLTPFDRAECETFAWVHKYAPKAAHAVLQPGKEVNILQNWLKCLTVTSTRAGPDSVISVHKSGARPNAANSHVKSKRKRRKAEGLEDFIISSDEEPDHMDEVSAGEFEDCSTVKTKSLVRSDGQHDSEKRPVNAVMLSGPHGCGKTAAIYAVATELGFEVFEINSSSRRSGRDILDRIGDMTSNHLVHQAAEEIAASTTVSDDGLVLDSTAVRTEIESGRQGTMTSFFKPKRGSEGAKVPKAKRAKVEPRIEKPESKDKSKLHRRQKQSLILLEEVDVLFDEDKQFWTTVLELVALSRRPVIMTCTDESLVPLESIPLHAILRLSSPPVQLVTDYLLLLLAREGHLVARDAISELYHTKGCDLRATIMALNFWCQMGIGDEKGGLEWIYQRWPPGIDVDERGDKLRVVSRGTFDISTEWLSRDIDRAESNLGFDTSKELLRELWENYGIGIEELHDDIFSGWDPDLQNEQAVSKAKKGSLVEQLDVYLDCLSSADVYCRAGLPNEANEHLDPTQPVLSQKTRLSFTDGLPLLQTDIATDPTHLTTDLALTTFLLAHKLSPLGPIPAVSSLMDHRKTHPPPSKVAIRASDFHAALDPFYSDTSALPSLTLETIATDVAPYVRSIAAHEQAIDAARASLLRSIGGCGGKMRMTRAARGALEGKERGSVRKERWWGGKVNLEQVRRTGGRGWEELGE